MANKRRPMIGSAQAAEILGWTRRKVQRAANTGQIPIVGKLGAQGELAFDPDAIKRIADEEKRKQQNP